MSETRTRSIFAVPLASALGRNLPAVVPTLTSRAAEIKAGHERVATDAIAFAADAIAVGEKLLALKDEMKARKLTGVWIAFVEGECGVPIRTAQRYIKKAQEKAKLSQMIGDGTTACRVLTKREASRVLSEPPDAKSRGK